MVDTVTSIKLCKVAVVKYKMFLWTTLLTPALQDSADAAAAAAADNDDDDDDDDGGGDDGGGGGDDGGDCQAAVNSCA